MDDKEHWAVVDRMRQRRMDALKEKDKEIERLRKALEDYGKHRSGCRHYYAENRCTCGFEQALKEE